LFSYGDNRIGKSSSTKTNDKQTKLLIKHKLLLLSLQHDL
jgi:hypothetical protein